MSKPAAKNTIDDKLLNFVKNRCLVQDAGVKTNQNQKKYSSSNDFMEQIAENIELKRQSLGLEGIDPESVLSKKEQIFATYQKTENAKQFYNYLAHLNNLLRERNHFLTNLHNLSIDGKDLKHHNDAVLPKIEHIQRGTIIEPLSQTDYNRVAIDTDQFKQHLVVNDKYLTKLLELKDLNGIHELSKQHHQEQEKIHKNKKTNWGPLSDANNFIKNFIPFAPAADVAHDKRFQDYRKQLNVIYDNLRSKIGSSAAARILPKIYRGIYNKYQPFGAFDKAFLSELEKLAEEEVKKMDEENKKLLGNFDKMAAGFDSEIKGKVDALIKKEDEMLAWRLLGLVLAVNPFFPVGLFEPFMDWLGPILNNPSFASGVGEVINNTPVLGPIFEGMKLGDATTWLLKNVPLVNNAVEITDAILHNFVSDGMFSTAAPLLQSPLFSIALAGAFWVNRAPEEIAHLDNNEALEKVIEEKLKQLEKAYDGTKYKQDGAKRMVENKNKLLNEFYKQSNAAEFIWKNKNLDLFNDITYEEKDAQGQVAKKTIKDLIAIAEANKIDPKDYDIAQKQNFFKLLRNNKDFCNKVTNRFLAYYAFKEGNVDNVSNEATESFLKAKDNHDNLAKEAERFFEAKLVQENARRRIGENLATESDLFSIAKSEVEINWQNYKNEKIKKQIEAAKNTIDKIDEKIILQDYQKLSVKDPPQDRYQITIDGKYYTINPNDGQIFIGSHTSQSVEGSTTTGLVGNASATSIMNKNHQTTTKVHNNQI